MTDRLPYTWIEREQRDVAAELLRGPLYLVNAASEALARTMEPLSSPSADSDVPASEYWIKAALINIAALSVRAGRAATVLVGAGYAPESMSSLRTLVESVNQIQWILQNPTGDRARNWLVDNRRQARSPSRVARSLGADGSFDLLSKRAHVTNTAAAAFRQSLDPDNRIPVTVVPSHDVPKSGSILFAVSGMLVEIAELLAEAWGVDEDPAVADVRMIRSVDSVRHLPLEELLLDVANPYRLDSPTETFV